MPSTLLCFQSLWSSSSQSSWSLLNSLISQSSWTIHRAFLWALYAFGLLWVLGQIVV
ncbi:hypothetical protein SDJN02_11858 [Cucurbita argyrosperma subsp. argyrosperma]|nr:hypothetical protein SDJN02_11858 [Cucurbita argyrosperma subsp. argyrosperma]